MDSNRLQKVESQIQKDMAVIFREFAQNKFPGVLFTVSSVRVSADLSIARINISLFPVKDKNEILEYVNEEKASIKNQLVRKMKGSLRKMPELYFYVDEAMDREAEIERILKNGGESPIKWD